MPSRARLLTLTPVLEVEGLWFVEQPEAQLVLGPDDSLHAGQGVLHHTGDTNPSTVGKDIYCYSKLFLKPINRIVEMKSLIKLL
jgi:hypothetical protein